MHGIHNSATFSANASKIFKANDILRVRWKANRTSEQAGPTGAELMGSAFFSYSRNDSEFAVRLARDLKAGGRDVWLDQVDILPGQQWDRAIEDALTASTHMLVILSAASVESPNVMDEVSFALEERKAVIPILYKSCKIPFRLRRLQYVDFTEDYASGLGELLKALPSRERVEASLNVGSQAQPEQVGLENQSRGRGEQAQIEEQHKRTGEVVFVEQERLGQSSRKTAERNQEGRETAHRVPTALKYGGATVGVFIVALILYWVIKSSPSKTQQPGLHVSDTVGWAIGERGVLLHTADRGSTWWKQDSGITEELSSVVFVTPQIGWVIASDGTILHTEDSGNMWQKQITVTERGFFSSITFLNPRSGWIEAGFYISHTEDGGRTWKRQFESKTGDVFRSIKFVTAQSGWVVGSSGLIWHTEDGGGTWNAQTSTTKENLSSLAFITSKAGWVVGDKGTILHTENAGDKWSRQDSGTTEWVIDVCFVTSDLGWAVGGGGTILHTSDGGRTWRKQDSGTDAVLTSISFISPELGWAVGGGGTILHTENGGRTWQKQNSNTAGTLTSATFLVSSQAASR